MLNQQMMKSKLELLIEAHRDKQDKETKYEAIKDMVSYISYQIDSDLREMAMAIGIEDGHINESEFMLYEVNTDAIKNEGGTYSFNPSDLEINRIYKDNSDPDTFFLIFKYDKSAESTGTYGKRSDGKALIKFNFSNPHDLVKVDDVLGHELVHLYQYHNSQKNSEYGTEKYEKGIADVLAWHRLIDKEEIKSYKYLFQTEEMENYFKTIFEDIKDEVMSDDNLFKSLINETSLTKFFKKIKNLSYSDYSLNSYLKIFHPKVSYKNRYVKYYKKKFLRFFYDNMEIVFNSPDFIEHVIDNKDYINNENSLIMNIIKDYNKEDIKKG